MHEDILVDIKEALASNMLDDLSKLEKPTVMYLADVLHDCRLTTPQDQFELYKCFQHRNEICQEIYRLQVEAITKNPTRIIKRIVARLEAKANPRKSFNSITDDDIERAREFLIEEIHEGELRKSGGKQWSICPFHSEKTGSFCIHADNRWSCFGGCGHGDSISFYMKLHGVEFIPAIRALINR